MKKFFLFFVLGFLGVFLLIAILSPKYPFSNKQSILKYSKEFNLKPEFVAAVIFSESGFNEKALSSKGAMGLMQLLPSTASEIASKLQFSDFNEEDLFNPDVNILFGCYYLRYLFNKYQNMEVVLAAYNAGMGVVNKWLSQTEFSDDGEILKAFPYPQTENYIKKVFKAENYYKGLL